jgi:ankyrin repeat protein
MDPLVLKVLNEKLYYSDDFELNKKLVEYNADINFIPECQLNSKLMNSLYNVELAKKIIELKADVNLITSYGLCALSNNTNNEDTIKLLLENNANIDIRNHLGETPVFYSKLLIKYKANVNARNNFGETPLFVAIRRFSFQKSKLLILNNADVFIRNMNNESPLDYAKQEMKSLLEDLNSDDEVDDNYENHYEDMQKFEKIINIIEDEQTRCIKIIKEILCKYLIPELADIVTKFL